MTDQTQLTTNQKHVTITVDGACLGNGKTETRAAAAGILEYRGRKRATACYIGPATNQRAEIIAAALALEALKQPCTVTLRTDSRYVSETMAGNFKRKTNLDLWERLDLAAAPHQVTFEWVRGHNGDPHQEAADRLARATAHLGDVSDLMLSETIARLDNTFSPAFQRELLIGLRYISGRCDGARHRDGVGFNRYDADYGHRLAAETDLSPLQVAASRRLLRRYEGQLNHVNPALVAML
jgi:ribonuclease HI